MIARCFFQLSQAAIVKHFQLHQLEMNVNFLKRIFIFCGRYFCITETNAEFKNKIRTNEKFSFILDYGMNLCGFSQSVAANHVVVIVFFFQI